MAAELTIHVHDRAVTAELGAGHSDGNLRRTLSGPAATLDGQLAAAIAEAVRSLETPARVATLVVPASWCYVHRVSVPPRRPSHTVLAYALEEYLPVDVEQLTCEFIRAKGREYLGVAVETQRLRGLLDACAAEGLRIERITLDVLHAAGHLPDAARLIWCDEEHLAVLTRDGRNLTDLRVVRLAGELSLEEWRRRAELHLRAGQTDNEQPALLAGCVDQQRLKAMADLLPVKPAAEPAERRQRDPACAGFNLARNGLASDRTQLRLFRAWRRAAAVVLAVLLLVAGGLQLHKTRLQSQVREVAAWERELFMEHFPGQPPPAGIALRLASERRRLEGLTLSGNPAALERPDALHTAWALIAAVPGDVSLDLDEIRIEGGAVTLRGRTRDHRQAERLAAAVNSIDGLQCGAPRTDRHRAGGVQFFLTARPDASSRKSAETEP